jgi:hypothetical protein
MNNRPPSDDESEKQQSLPNARPVRGELLKKIYYPDTLYPDGHTFFADRRSRMMETNEQPTGGASNNTATTPKIPTIEIEMTERQNKYSVSVVCSEKEKTRKCYFRQASMLFDAITVKKSLKMRSKPLMFGDSCFQTWYAKHFSHKTAMFEHM